jgi:hypothetical protein
MKNKLDIYLDYALNELLKNTDYRFFDGRGKKYVAVFTPRLKQLGGTLGYVYDKKEVEEWEQTIGFGGVWDTKYLQDVYGLTWLEAKGVIEKYVHTLATKVLGEWE